MSYLLYDGDELSLTLCDDTGKPLSRPWPASNRGVPDKKGKEWLKFIPDGTYDFEVHSQHLPHKHADHPEYDTLNGRFGTHGIFLLNRVTINGIPHDGLGVHAGRHSMADTQVLPQGLVVHHKGPHYVTHGCIRTTEEAMRAISAAITKDPLRKLKIRNNGKASSYGSSH